MRIKLGELKRIFREAALEEAGKVGAHPEYMKKERARELLQGAIASAVASGQIQNEADLQEFFAAVPLAMTALKMVPFEVYSKIAGTKPRSG
jgi:hypothetical protein